MFWKEIKRFIEKKRGSKKMYDVFGIFLGTFLIFVALYRYFFVSYCEKCGTKFYYRDAKREPYGESQGTRYLREGEEVTLCSIHKILNKYNCKKCDYENKYVSWVTETILKRIDKPFKVKICKMCKGNGKLHVNTSGGFRLVGTSLKYVSGGSGSATCGLCDGNGWKRIKNTN